MARKAKRSPARKAGAKKPAARKPASRKSAAKKPARAIAKKIAKKKPAARKPAPTPRTNDGGPPDWPSLSPYMTVRDAAESLEFYGKAFGFKVEGVVMRDQQGVVQHAGMSLGQAKIMFAPQGMSAEMQTPASSGALPGLSLYVYVPDVDALARRAEGAGVRCLQQPADQFWGDRIAIFKDPDGYHWTFATHVSELARKAPV